MQVGSDSNVVIIKLSTDEDVHRSLEEVVKNNNIRSGVILSGIGMLKEFELGYFDPAGYKRTFFKEPHELVSMSGSIAYSDDDKTKLLLHIHCSVANSEHQVKGGHLHQGKVNIVNEITILKLDKLNLSRVKNETTGLMELNIN